MSGAVAAFQDQRVAPASGVADRFASSSLSHADAYGVVATHMAAVSSSGVGAVRGADDALPRAGVQEFVVSHG